MKKGNIVVLLLLIIVASIGLYFAWYNGDIVKVPVATSGSTLAELWETNWEGRRNPPGRAAKAGKTTAAVPAKNTKSSYYYANEYELFPRLTSTDNPYLICVNRYLHLPAKYSVSTAVCVTVYPENKEMEKTAAAQFRKMYDAAREAGAELIPFSAYRTIRQQKENFDREIRSLIDAGLGRVEAIERALRTIQLPGCSEHETGLAIDITRKGVWRTDPGFDTSKEFQWLQKHAHEYGFILRYPRGKESITGISYEPWHWRYVGVEAATAMKNSGKCLEEYLGIKN